MRKFRVNFTKASGLAPFTDTQPLMAADMKVGETACLEAWDDVGNTVLLVAFDYWVSASEIQ